MVLCVRKGLDCMVLAAGDDKIESLCIRMKGEVNKVGIAVQSATDHPARMTTVMNYSTRN